MSIVYYPNKTIKKLGSAIDRVMAKRNVLTVRGAANVAATGLDIVVSAINDGDGQNHSVYASE